MRPFNSIDLCQVIQDDIFNSRARERQSAGTEACFESTKQTVCPAESGSSQSKAQRQGTIKNSQQNVNVTINARLIFFISCMCIVLILIPFTTETFKMVQDFIKYKPADYEWPSIKDFWLTLVMTPVFFILERVFQWALYPWYWQYCKEKVDLEVRDIRTRKAVNNIYKCIYYSFSTFCGWYTLKDSYILPPALGGNGSLENLFTDFPYIKPPPLYKYYFTGTMGYHIGSLLHHALAHQKSNDYLEMMFHHLVTFYLYSFSYMSNTSIKRYFGVITLIGAVIAYIHDVADIGVTWTRAWSETKHGLFTAISFIITLVFWFYTLQFQGDEIKRNKRLINNLRKVS